MKTENTELSQKKSEEVSLIGNRIRNCLAEYTGEDLNNLDLIDGNTIACALTSVLVDLVFNTTNKNEFDNSIETIIYNIRNFSEKIKSYYEKN